MHLLTLRPGLALILLTASVTAADWAHWRGPAFNGSSPETNLPVEFSPTNNVKWRVELPGPSAATPIVSGDCVFVSSSDAQSGSLLALALDRKSGRQLWKHDMGPGPVRDNLSNLASPSAVTDGKQVVFLYGNGALAAFDFAGKELWKCNLETDYGPFAYQWTYGASPTIYESKLFVQVLQRDVPVNRRGRTDGPIESYLLALEPATGQELWRHVRPSDALAESKEAYSTPIPVSVDGTQQMLIVGGDCITGHDLTDGRELWRWGTWNTSRIGHWRLVPCPVTDGKVALAVAPKGAPVYAVKLGGRGTLAEDALAWKSADRDVSSDVSTPALYEGRFYVLNSDRKTIARVDPATGRADWIGQLDSRVKFESSPTAADGKLYFQSHAGEVFVVGTGSEFKVLHRAAMGEANERNTRATIAVSDGNLFIRTAGKLYCVGK